MSTLVEVITQGAISGTLTGVKRPLSLPTAIPTQLPAFRGVPNEPGNAIKAPKLIAGNRSDRGTNVLTPIARVTALTSIGINNGRLSPGDVAFVRRTPGGYLKAIDGPSAGIGHMVDMFGIDGVNRFLSGTLNGARVWQLGNNMIDSIDTVIDDTTNLFGNAPAILAQPPKPYLSALREYQFDGVILSNEEPYSFLPNGGRDATIFNVGIKGAAPVNNGFMTYDTHAPTELYARGADPLAYGETLRIGSERAGDTWHGKTGYDFVAAYTSVYTEYPLQMFGRDIQPLDSAYLILRKFNLLDDVVVPRVKALLEQTMTIIKNGSSVATSPYDSPARARSAVLSQIRVKDADGIFLNMTSAEWSTDAQLRAMVFFQYMPCSSRAFVKYHQTLKIVDAAVDAASPGKFNGLLHNARGSGNPVTGLGSLGAVRDNYARNETLAELLRARINVYVGGVYKQDRMNNHDPVRFLDLLLCAGAWKLGKIIDTRSARGTPYGNGPTNGSYRCSIVLDIEWLPRNKSIQIDVNTSILKAASAVQNVGRSLHRPTAYWHTQGRAYASVGSKERNILSAMARQTLAERELHEAPLIPGLQLVNPLIGTTPPPQNTVTPPTPPPPSTLKELQDASKKDFATAETVFGNIEESINDADAFGSEVASVRTNDEIREILKEAMRVAGEANTRLAVATASYGDEETDAELVKDTLEAIQTFELILNGEINPLYQEAMRTTLEWISNPVSKSLEVAADNAFNQYIESVAGFESLATSSSAIMNRVQRHLTRITIGQKTNAIIRSLADAARTAAIAPITAAVTSSAAKNAGKQPIAKRTSTATSSTAPPPIAPPPTAPPPAAPKSIATPPIAPPPTAPKSIAPPPTAPPAPLRSATPLAPTPPAAVSAPPSIVDATIAASRRAAAAAKEPVVVPEAPAPGRALGVVDSVFDTIFGTPAPGVPLASPSSPTPSSGSETGPRAFTRRNR